MEVILLILTILGAAGFPFTVLAFFGIGPEEIKRLFNWR